MSDAPGAARTQDLGRACSHACLFCAQAGAPEPGDASEPAGTEPPEATDLTLTGGEPSLRDDLEEIVERLGRSHRLRLQTNGARLDSERLERLAGAGLCGLELTLHAAKAEAHDFLTGRAGSFAKTAQVLVQARELGLEVRVTTTLCRSNFRHAAELTDWLAARAVAGHAFIVLRAAGRAREHLPRLMPRLGMAIPRALEAASRGARRGLAVGILGAPACLLGPHQEVGLPSPSRAYPEPCQGCPRRDTCPGVDPDYADRFGVAELSPRRARPAKPPPASLAGLTGVGLLA